MTPAREPAGEKLCPVCGEEKPRAAFFRDRHRRDGLSYLCRACKGARDRLRYAERLAAEGRAVDPARSAAIMRGRARAAAERAKEAAGAKRDHHGGVSWWDREPLRDTEYVLEMDRRRELNTREGDRRTCLDCPTRLRRTRPPGDERCDRCERKHRERQERKESNGGEEAA